ncbi:MAG: hypothetical protein GY856_04440 [bacterium]|nr:hypothetical protein [bacterium]
MSQATEESLAIRLRQANSGDLLELVRNHLRELTVREVRQTLRNPFVTAEVIEELVLARQLLSIYEVRSIIARHRRTPEVIAMRFVSGLYWRDLLEMVADVRIRPAVRRVAEKYLIQRLPRLAVGEKVTIARRAPLEVIAQLHKDPSLHVIRAFLGNPRLTEESLLPLVIHESTSTRVLDLVASNPRWGRRYAIRAALSRNPRTPFRVVFDILPQLRRKDLIEVVHCEAHSWVVKHRARELLEGEGD